MTTDAVRNAWYPVGLLSGLSVDGEDSLLLGEKITKNHPIEKNKHPS